MYLVCRLLLERSASHPHLPSFPTRRSSDLSRRDDQVGNLRRQEAAQPPHALDLADLLVDALLESLVQGAQLLRLRLELGRLLANFGEQSREIGRAHV